MEAVASQPPVAPGGSVDVTPVAGGTSMTALPSAMKELARFFLNLSGSSSLGASGDSAGVTASAAALGGLAGPSSSAAGAATVCGTAATPAGAGVLPDASTACLGSSGVGRDPALVIVAVDRLTTGPTGVLRSDPGGGLLLLNALRFVGRSAIALPRIRLRMSELPLLLLEPDVRMEVRVLVVPPGIMTVRGHMQGWIQTSLGRVVARLGLRAWLTTNAPLPSSR